MRARENRRMGCAGVIGFGVGDGAQCAPQNHLRRGREKTALHEDPLGVGCERGPRRGEGAQKRLIRSGRTSGDDVVGRVEGEDVAVPGLKILMGGVDVELVGDVVVEQDADAERVDDEHPRLTAPERPLGEGGGGVPEGRQVVNELCGAVMRTRFGVTRLGPVDDAREAGEIGDGERRMAVIAIVVQVARVADRTALLEPVGEERLDGSLVGGGRGGGGGEIGRSVGREIGGEREKRPEHSRIEIPEGVGGRDQGYTSGDDRGRCHVIHAAGGIGRRRGFGLFERGGKGGTGSKRDQIGILPDVIGVAEAECDGFAQHVERGIGFALPGESTGEVVGKGGVGREERPTRAAGIFHGTVILCLRGRHHVALDAGETVVQAGQTEDIGTGCFRATRSRDRKGEQDDGENE